MKDRNGVYIEGSPMTVNEQAEWYAKREEASFEGVRISFD